MTNNYFEKLINDIKNGNGIIFSISDLGMTFGGCGCCSDDIPNDDLSAEQKDIIAKEAIKRWSVWLIDNK